MKPVSVQGHSDFVREKSAEAERQCGRSFRAAIDRRNKFFPTVSPKGSILFLGGLPMAASDAIALLKADHKEVAETLEKCETG
jgi:hypothetical protein